MSINYPMPTHRMGQVQMQSNNNSPRVPYEENGDNGLVMCDIYIPEELISEILCYVDYESLSKCQLVCKRWNNLVDNYIWRKKAEVCIGHSLQSVKVLPWNVYYDICKKKPIGRNLLKNNSGQNGFVHWRITQQGGDHWKVESPPIGVPPFPNNSVFEGVNSCFVTSYSRCTKRQIIYLTEEGLPSVLLDTLQPLILVSEWYSSRWDCPAVYECNILLVGESNKVLDTYHFRESIDGDDKQNLWHYFEYEFQSYGPGLRKIVFDHSGCDSFIWKGHYGSKMAGASVILKYQSSKDGSKPLKNKFLVSDPNSSASEADLSDNSASDSS